MVLKLSWEDLELVAMVMRKIWLIRNAFFFLEEIYYGPHVIFESLADF